MRQIASLLQIPESIVFLDVVNAKRSTIRIWTEGMTTTEKATIRANKSKIKALAAKTGAKVALSDRHPLGEDGQSAFEKRRRASRSAALKGRKLQVPE